MNEYVDTKKCVNFVSNILDVVITSSYERVIGEYINNRYVIFNNAHVSDIINLFEYRLPVVCISEMHKSVGDVILLPINNQEFLDMLFLSFRIAYNFMIPVSVVKPLNVREEITIPTRESILKFIPKMPKVVKRKFITRVNKPVTLNIKFIEKLMEKWFIKYKRSLNLLELSNSNILSYGRNAEYEVVGKLRILEPLPEIPKNMFVIDSVVSHRGRGLLQEILNTDGIVTQWLSKETLNDILSKER